LTVENPVGNVVVPLSGQGTLADVDVSPLANDFGDQPVSAGATAGQTFRITNTGSADLSVTAIALGGDAPTDYALDASGCGGGTTTVAAGADCTVSVRFAPQGAGVRNALLAVTTDVGTINATLRGRGTVPDVSIDPTAHDFGVQPAPEGPTGPFTFTVSNPGTADLTVTRIDLAGDEPGAFTVDPSRCGPGGATTLAAGGSCTVDVAFDPPDVGYYNAELQVTTRELGTIGATVEGRHGIAVAQLEPVGHDFGEHPVGSGPTAAVPFTLSNVGDDELEIRDVNLGGDGDHFDVDASDCTGRAEGQAGGLLEPGERCDLRVDFQPKAEGPQNSTVGVDSTGGSLFSTLSGTGAVTGGGGGGGGGGNEGGGGHQPPPVRRHEPPARRRGDTTPRDVRTGVFDGRYLYVLVTCPRRFRPSCRGVVYGYTVVKPRRAHGRRGHRHATSGRRTRAKVVRITSRGRVSVRAGRRQVVRLLVSPRYRRAVIRMTRSRKRLLRVRQIVSARHFKHGKRRTIQRRLRVVTATANRPPARGHRGG
jgi:hypothetical protein